MQKLREAKLLAEKLIQIEKKEKKAALLTVISKKGSAYRSEGAKFLITEDGQQFCGISGGCLEKGLSHTAKKVIKTGEPVIEHADLQDRETWGIWLGCPGEVDILIEPIVFNDVLKKWIELVLKGINFVLVKNVKTLESGVYTEDEHYGSFIGDLSVINRKLRNRKENAELIGDLFYDKVLIYPPIVFFGKGEEILFLRELSKNLDIPVITANPEEKVFIPDDSFVIIANHHIKLDRLSLKIALSSKASYIGVISSLKRFEKVSEGLEVDERVRVPAGLDIGGEYPDEVVLSILSEIIASFNSKSGESLSKIKGTAQKGGAI